MTAGNLGVYVTSSLQMAPGNINAKSILVEDGVTIATFGTAIQLGLVRCILDGGGFLKDEIYYPTYDASMVRTAFKSIFADHDHSADGAKKGGTYKTIIKANMAPWLDFFRMANPNDFYKVAVNAGSDIVWDTDTTQTHQRILFKTGTAANSKVSGTIGGLRLNWDDWIDMQVRMEMNQSANVSYRVGVNVDRIEDTQSTTRAQIGLEGCPAHGVNFVVISSNGNAGNLTATSTTHPLTSNLGDYQLTFKPGLETKFYYIGVLKATTNSANTPSTGNVDRNKYLVMGVANDGTGAQKDFEVYYYRMNGKPFNDEFFNIV